MCTHNIDFYEEISKLSFNYHQISSNTHLISSSETSVIFNMIRGFILVIKEF